MPFLPLDDDTPSSILIERPWVTWGVMALCLVVFWVQSLSGQLGGERLILGFGVIPVTLSGDAALGPALYKVHPLLTLITYQFLHSGMFHLAGNLLYLWVFGDNVEDAMGHSRFALFYLLCGVIAGGAHWLAGPQSEIPLIGASGAISGVLGAYLILHPKAKILVPIYFIPVSLPAWLLLVFWFGFQVVSAMSAGPSLAGTAWWAHIGGFIAGAILVVPFRLKTVHLFGGGDLPEGITLRDRKRWQRFHAKHPNKRGPWGD
jgi:membrane associated rhomboid family serine protease